MKKERLDQHLYGKLSKPSAELYLRHINHFLATHKRAKNYQYKDVVSYFDELKTRYPNVNTRIIILGAVKQYYDYLVKTNQRKDHPCKLFFIESGTSPRSQAQFQDLFTAVELEKLLSRDGTEKLKLRNKIIISLLIYQALTLDEIVRLEISNIDFDQSTIYIKGSAKLSSRTLDLRHAQLEYLQEYIHEQRMEIVKVKTKRLFIGYRGHPETVDAMQRMLLTLRGLYPDRKLHATTIRQSVIANWLNLHKFPLDQVQMWAGIKWPSSAQRYKRSDMAQQREKINKWYPLR